MADRFQLVARIYIDWEIPDMTGVNPGDTFTFTTDPQDHLLGPATSVRQTSSIPAPRR